MSYQALYRRWRPDTFDTMVGQDAVVKTLKNQVTSGRIGHAYLFCGTRGTGKTSAAKILARAANCPNAAGNGGNPCNKCASCRSILEGGSVDVFEIDAASNNGVDNIRDIRDEVDYPPVSARFKVYIIDEVHMLSAGAFNALLKTLEEPPAYVIFILATTDPQKVPQTILSRCQRYDFRRIPRAVIFKQLEGITRADGINIEEKALNYIAEAGDGSMRDALSLLEQCISYHREDCLTYDDVLAILGAGGAKVYSGLLHEINDADVKSALLTINSMINQGGDALKIAGDFIWYLRNVLLAGSVKEGAEDILDISKDTFDAAKADAFQIEKPFLMELIRGISELLNRARFSPQKRVLLEMEVIRLCTLHMPGAGAPAGAGKDKGTAEVSVNGAAAPQEALPWDEGPMPAAAPGPAPQDKRKAAPAESGAPSEGAVKAAFSQAASLGSPEGAGTLAEGPPRHGQGAGTPASAAPGSPPAKAAPGRAVSPETPPGAPPAHGAAVSDFEVILNNWDQLVDRLKASNRPLFKQARLKEEGGMPVVVFKNSMSYKLAARNTEENGVVRLRELAGELLGHTIKLNARMALPGEAFEEAAVQKITDEELSRIKFHVDIED